MSMTACLLCVAIPIGQVLLGKPGEDIEQEIKEKRLELMRSAAKKLQAVEINEGQRHPLDLIENPLLRFNDPAREFHDATLWAWGKEGRPWALVTMEQYGDKRWWFELHSLTTDKTIEVVASDKLTWKPAQPGLVFQPFPGGPLPADNSAGNIRQAKELARKLAVHEIGYNGQRYELRLMPQPVHRYMDQETGLLDGAMFAFAYGTNPEMLALLEARREEGSEPHWTIAFARIAAAGLHVECDEQELWSCPYQARPTTTDTYIYFQQQP